MKAKWIYILLVAGMFGMSSCEKEYMGPVDNSGAPLQLRGGEDGSGETVGDSGGTITDTGHDSDYDSKSNKKKKATAPN